MIRGRRYTSWGKGWQPLQPVHCNLLLCNCKLYMYCINSNICNLFPSFYLFFLLTLLFSIFNCNVKWNKEKKLKEYKKPTLVPEVFFLFSNLTEKKKPWNQVRGNHSPWCGPSSCGEGGDLLPFHLFCGEKVANLKINACFQCPFSGG